MDQEQDLCHLRQTLFSLTVFVSSVLLIATMLVSVAGLLRRRLCVRD